jgi:uncharacterized protein YndB with AHSA1/START domain
VKKTVKPIKSKPISQKSNSDKGTKKAKTAPAVKGGAKSAKKNVVTKVVKKAVKKVVKKAVKPLKKVLPKKAVAKKVVKPISKLKVKELPKNNKSKQKSSSAKKVVVSSNKKTDKKTIAVVPKVVAKVPSKAVKVEKAAKVKEIKKVEKVEKVRVPKDIVPKPPKKSKGGRKPKNKDDEDEPIIEEDILIEQLINSTKKLKKPVKVPKQLRTFTNPMASLTVANVDVSGKAVKALSKKEPKGKFELEYVIRTSAGILYEFLTSPSGLSEWFADDVNIHDGVFTFFWEGSEQKAKLLAFKEDKFVRLQWLDKPEGTYFEFRIERDELTGDTSLMIVDFADEASDMETSKRLWDSQVNTLLNVIGSY